MYLPTKTYEALPSIYVVIGISFVLGALYLGTAHGLMVGYLAIGITCIAAGVVVKTIRHRARSNSDERMN